MASDSLAKFLETALGHLPGLLHGPISDPYSVGHYHRAQQPNSLEWGLVYDFVPGLHAYKILLSGGITCVGTIGSVASYVASGCRVVDTIRLGTNVLVTRNYHTPAEGVIVAAMPGWSAHRGYQVADAAWPFFRTGHSSDRAHTLPVTVPLDQIPSIDLNNQPVTAVPDYNAGRTLDATSVGERGALTETGVGYFVDPFHCFLRVDEATGVFGFYHNQLLRVAGHNIQRWSVLEDEEQLEDAGELYGVRKTCVYPHESYGLWYRDQTTPLFDPLPVAGRERNLGFGTKWFNPVEVQDGTNSVPNGVTGCGFAVREPEKLTQTMAARCVTFEGYLGQGGKEVVALPMQFSTAEKATPNTVPPASFESQTDHNAQLAVYESFKALTGAWHVRSSKRIIFAKRLIGALPQQTAKPADPIGDRAASNYAASGVGTSISDDIADGASGAKRNAYFPDLLGYMLNWEAVHPFAKHALDWRVREESAVKTGDDVILNNQQTPTYTEAATQQWLTDFTPVTLDVDHRYPNSNYYQNEAVIAMLDDGQILIYDGWGTEVKLHNGHATISASQDINLRAGRNVNIWAGDDVNIKARTSVDIAAEYRDVRAWAGKNIQMLAGNLGCGGILLETQATCPAHDYTGEGEDAVIGGIVLVAPASSVFTYTPEFAVESPTDDGRYIVAIGEQGTIRHAAKIHHTLVHDQGTHAVFFKDGIGLCSIASEMTQTYMVFGQSIMVDGGITAAENIVTAGTVAAVEKLAAGDTTVVYRLTAPAITNIDTAVADFQTRLFDLKEDVCENLNAAAIGPPNARYAEFSLRNDEQLRTDFGYQIWEARWQTLAREDFQFLPVWESIPVTSRINGFENYPFPGGQWVTGAYLKPNFNIVNTNGWYAKDRGDGTPAYYATPTIPLPTTVTPQAGYTVTTTI